MDYEVLSYEVGTLMAKSYVDDETLHYIASSILRCFHENEFVKKEMEVGIVTELLNTMTETDSKTTLPKILDSYRDDLNYLLELDDNDFQGY